MTGPFKDEGLNGQFHRYGFCKIPLLKAELVQAFLNASNDFLQTIDQAYLRGFHSLSHHNDPKIRNTSIELIAAHYLPELARLIHPDFELLPGVHLIKSRGFRTKLGFHQDSALVDEMNSFSLQAWMPLQNTTTLSGTISIIPGSQRYNNYQRGPTVPNTLLGQIKRVGQYRKSVSMKAGEVLFFDSRMIHGSGRNFTLPLRIAVNAIIKPKNDPLIYYFYDREADDQKVEMYEITDAFYMNEDIYTRPSSNARILRTEPLHIPEYDAMGLREAGRELKGVL